MTATSEQLTAEGNLHGLAAMVGMPAFLVAAVALHGSLRPPRRHGARRPGRPDLTHRPCTGMANWLKADTLLTAG